jgi:general secretion pathway protein G
MARIEFPSVQQGLPRAHVLESWSVVRGPLPDSAATAIGSARGREVARSTVHGPRAGGRGFTLIELIVVVAIIGILATIAVPAMRTAPMRAKESALKEDLFTLRSCLDQFHADRGRYPTTLAELVSMGYLRSVPVDPETNSRDTWAVAYEEVTSDQQDDRQQQAGPGIIDIHSGSEGTALDGTKFADW